MKHNARYESDAGRWLEIVCGLALIFFALLMAAVAVLLLVQGRLRLGVFAAVAILGVMAFGLSRLAVRLLRGQRSPNQGLLSPAGLLLGALFFVVGGVGMLVDGIIGQDAKQMLLGIGILPASFYAWRLAMDRKRSAATPNNSLERTGEP